MTKEMQQVTIKEDGIFKNIATNVNTVGVNTNVVVKNFGTEQLSLSEIIENSKKDSDFTNKKVGVYFGDFAWK